MKKYTVKNYKGNLLEATKKFLDTHKGMKIVEAFEDSGTLNIMADQFPAETPEVAAQDTKNTMAPETNALMDFGSKLLTFGVETHLWHLNCARNAQHLALKELYEACDDVGDRLLEAEIGVTDQPAKFTNIDIDPTFTDASIDKIVAIKSEAEALVGKFGAGPDNILGEFCEICDSVVYKLRRLA